MDLYLVPFKAPIFEYVLILSMYFHGCPTTDSRTTDSSVRPLFAAVVDYIWAIFFTKIVQVILRGTFQKKRNENRTKIGQVSPGVNCPESNVLESNVRSQLSWSQMSGVNCPGVNCPESIVLESIVRSQLSGVNCPESNVLESNVGQPKIAQVQTT